MKLIKPNRRETRYFELAKKHAEKSTHLDVRIGSVIVIGNFVASYGFNQAKSHPIQRSLDRATKYYSTSANLHSEVSCLIRSGRRDLTGAEIFIFREDKQGDIAMCRPCVSCQKAIHEAGIRHIYYTSREGYCYEKV